MVATACEHCGVALPRSGRGRPARFCSGAHRVAAHRSRTSMPREMIAQDRWVRYTADKVPVQAESGRNASAVARRTWGSYEQVKASPHGVGNGFVLNAGGIVCIDLDDCVRDGRVDAWAQRVLDLCPGTFVELSVSGTGLHVWGHGRLASNVVIRDGRRIEVYDRARYIATTSVRWRGAPLKLGDLSTVLGELT